MSNCLNLEYGTRNTCNNRVILKRFFMFYALIASREWFNAAYYLFFCL